jgi:calcium-dependent protein kinase
MYFNFLKIKLDWEKISSYAKDLLQNILCNVKSRSTAQQVLDHDWMKNIGEESNSYDQIKSINYKNLIEFSKMNMFKKNILSFMAFRGNYKELHQLNHLFIAVDNNGDGLISFEEFENCFKKSNIENIDLDMKNLFKEIDINKDGFINYIEFMASLLDEKNIITEEKIYEAFRMFDKDNSGKISYDEFNKVLNINETELEFMKDFVNQYDINNDGEIDYEEFCKMSGLELKKKNNLEEFINNKLIN